MANTLLTINMITREAVRLWKNTNAFLRNINTDYDDYYANTGAKIGNQLRIRTPNSYVPRYGAGASIQDTVENSVTLTLSTMVGVDLGFGTADLTLSIDDFSEMFLAPAINTIAGAVAVGIMSASEGGVCNYIDNESGGVIISPTSTTVLTAGAILDTQSAPEMNRRLVTDPYTDARVAGSLTGLFNPSQDISDQYRSGAMKNALGFDWMKDQTVIKHVTGSFSAGTVSGAGQTGSTITTGAITGTLAVGDIITIAGVFGVNRINFQSYGALRQFVVLAAAASGATSISIYPPLIPPVNGNAVQYQTVSASPANAAAITLVSPANSTYRKNLAFVPEAVTMATADLILPSGNVEAAREEFDGVSMRLVRQYMVETDNEITRLDTIFGVLFIRPEWCVVIADAL